MPAAPTYDARFQNQQNAKGYADRFERPTHRHINQREQRTVAKILGSLSDVASVLDMPSGAGRFLPTLLRPGRRLIEIDVAHEMLQLSRQRVEEGPTGNGSRVSWVQGSAFGLPLGDGAVDCIFCNRLLHHFHTPEERIGILRELRRVTRRYVIVSFFDYHRFGPLRVWLKRLRGRRPDYSGHPTKAGFDGEVAQAGFNTVSITPTGPLWVAQVYYLLERL